MKGDVVPDDHNITRLCRNTHRDPDTGEPLPTAFMLKAGESALSVNWLEHLALGDRALELEEVRRVMLSKLEVRASAALAVLNVGRARLAVREGTPDRREVSVLHDPEERPGQWIDPSHSGIYNLPIDASAAEQLALAVEQTYPAKAG